jgi:PIN domain nuclease of toxin-antitoxin system
LPVSSWVLDASAVLAHLHGEEGSERVIAAIKEGALMSAVNLSEVVARLTDRGLSEEAIGSSIGLLGVPCVPFDEGAAYAAGLLRPGSRAAGLSLGDRACLALGRERNLPVLTADRAWSGLDLGTGIEVVLLR